MSNFVKNVQILANAGSGKTHTLITRLIALLSMGARPSSIVALTFTRNAAGEFLVKLMRRLEEASSSTEKAAELSRHTGIPGNPEGYLKLLRSVISEMDRLEFTTLDGFFGMIASAYPGELGLPGSPVLIDPSSEHLVADAVLRRALVKFRASDPDGFRKLTEAFLVIEEGSAKRSIADRLDKFRKEAHAMILDYPSPDAWGDPSRIWTGAACPFGKLSPAAKEAARLTILNEPGEPAFPVAAKKAWDLLASLAPGSKTNAILEKILGDLPSWRAGTAELPYNRHVYHLPAATQQAAAALADDYLHECTWMRLREAKAIHALLVLFEQEYEGEVRRRGSLSFSDITRVLAPSDGFGGLDSAGKGNRLRIDEKLDGRLDHWLLDEFQDTSRSQYAVLANLLREVICDTGDRSFFCVGDVKQAIYGWRNGDARLFGEMLAEYGRGDSPNALRQAIMASSWRSSSHVLHLLNRLFGKVPEIAGIPGTARQRWADAWQDHAPEKELDGCFRWEIAGGEAGEKDDTIKEGVISLLRSVEQKIREGMTAALLVRSGKDALEWLEILAAAGIRAVGQSNPKAGADNPLSAAVRSAIGLIAHPGDRFAGRHLSMDPLAGVSLWCDEGEFRLEKYLERASRVLADGGFPALMELLLGYLLPLLAKDDVFSRERADSLRGIALKAERSGIRDIDDFLRILADHEEKGISSPDAVQVMTIHKSKGLEYDMVVLPFLRNQNALDTAKSGVIDVCNPRGVFPPKSDDVLLVRLPSEEVRNACGNETLRCADEVRRDEQAYEELCTWYVAMSRAKHGLYVFSSMPDPEDRKNRATDCPSITLLMKWILDDDRSWGNREWITGFRPEKPIVQAMPLPNRIEVRPRPAALPKRKPSDEGHGPVSGSLVFNERDAAVLGTAVHSLFEEIEWIEGMWTPPAHGDTEACRLLGECLESPAVKTLFTRPAGNIEVWRERRFDLILDGAWISGCFDRVVIRNDGEGRVTGVDLVDFKTDSCEPGDLVGKYAPQLFSYRKVLSRILSVDESLVTSLLVHVRSGTVVTL